MKKILVFRLLLSAVVFFVMHSCRTEEELNPRNTEKGTLQYGISGEAFLNTTFITNLKNSKASKNTNSQKMASDLTADELMQRLYLEGAHLNSSNGKEVLHVPVITPGTYKRTLLSISENGHSTVLLFTYPDPNDHRFFYIMDLQGNLLKEVRIGDDGKEIQPALSKNPSVQAEKSGDCSLTIYTTCSSGEHSFEYGNAYSCSFWHNLSAGSPPTLLTQSGDCGGGGGGFGGGGGGSGGGGSSGGGGGGGSTSPVGGGPKHQLTHSDCIQNLDCNGCNIPGDTDNDCVLSYAEAMAFNNDPCVKTKNILENPQITTKIDELKTQSTLGGEKGVKFKKNGTPSETITGGAHSVNFGDKTGYAGGYHNHTPTGIPMLSPPDIDQLLGFARAQPTSSNNTGNAFMGMVAPNGMHYVIWFKGTYQDALTNFSQEDLDAYTKLYRRQEAELSDVEISGTAYIDGNEIINSAGVEKLFFNTLKKMGLEGKVILQRVESDGTINSINLDSNNQPTASPC